MGEGARGGGHSHGGHSHGGHSHGGHSHGENSPGHGVAVEDGFVAAKRPEGSSRSELSRGAGRGKVLFFDMQSGIAGDMTIAGLVDLGVPFSVIEEAVSHLGLPGIELRLESGYAGAIGASHFDVSWPQQAGERSFKEIERLINESRLADSIKALAIAIFTKLAHAEAAVHRTTLEHVHFHEVGAVDAIVDIVGAATAFDYLGAEVLASPVPLGRGFVECRHGRLPLPAPAALECLRGVPTFDSGLEAELVTPTGAAIIATVARDFVEWASLVPERIGWGAGTRGLPDRPNALRVVFGEERGQSSALTHAIVETNIDDMSGELAGHAVARLLEVGAVDAWLTPITMKKGRPGLVVSALCERKAIARISEIILTETSSIGVRQSLVSRMELPRSLSEVQTPWGPVRVKESALGTEAGKAKPEVDDCVAISKREGIPLRTVLAAVQNLIQGRHAQ